MRPGIPFYFTAAALLLITGLGFVDSTASKPAGFTIKGTVKTASGWDLQNPDLSRVVVYLAADAALAPAQTAPSTAAHPHATVSQKNKTFTPNFLVIPTGTDVEFPNWDNFDHNVFSLSKAAPAFDLDRYPKGQSKTRNFDKVGVVQVFCNIHPEMRAVIVVTPNQFFARADADGKFQLTNIPAGRYDLIAWQERCGEQKQAIDVHDGSLPDISFTLSETRKAIVTDDVPPRDSTYGVERGLGVKREKLNLPVVKESHPAVDPEK